MTYILSTFTFQNLTRYTIFFELSVLIITSIALIISMFFLPESPKYLINKNRTEEARMTLNTIARFNKVGSDFNEVVFVVETVSKSDAK